MAEPTWKHKTTTFIVIVLTVLNTRSLSLERNILKAIEVQDRDAYIKIRFIIDACGYGKYSLDHNSRKADL